MLVLSRQRDETIMIGDDIEITVVDIRGDKIRLGIDAPSDVAVHRKEVYEAIRRENEQAARLDAGQIDQLRLTSPNQQNASRTAGVRQTQAGTQRKRRAKGLRAVTSVHERKPDSKQCKSA